MVAVDDVDPRTVLVRPVGDVDLRGAARLRQVLESVREADQERIVVDMSQVGFMDSTGLSVLIAFRRRLASSRSVELVGMNAELRRLLRVTGLEDSFAGGAAQSEPASEPAPATTAKQPQSSSPPAPRALPALTDDAATALALAATALPFAASTDEQAERWLRTLRHHGDAGVILGSLGVSDELAPAPTPAGAEQTPSPADVVARVTELAAELARRHGAATTHTSDLLEAVRDTYGPSFERALARHAADSEDVAARLDLLLRERG